MVQPRIFESVRSLDSSLFADRSNDQRVTAATIHEVLPISRVRTDDEPTSINSSVTDLKVTLEINMSANENKKVFQFN